MPTITSPNPPPPTTTPGDGCKAGGGVEGVSWRAEQYFRGVSPLARRMLDDMAAVQERYGEEWPTLSYQSQCRIIDQAMVDEATVLRYEGAAVLEGGVDGEGLRPEYQYFPKLKLPTGQKVVRDENLTARGFSCSWRDEHSAPFSWHTRSQMDLTLDTPPATPTDLNPHPAEHHGEGTGGRKVSGEGRVIPGGVAVYSAPPPVSLPRPPRFRWHYDPPDPSSVIVEPPARPEDSTENSPAKYLVVKDPQQEPQQSLLAKIRGAVAALTATCLPLTATSSLISLYTDNQPAQDPVRPQTTHPHTLHQSDDANGNRGHATNPLAELPSDPSLMGYYCTLPDDDDDLPYTPRAALIPHEDEDERKKEGKKKKRKEEDEERGSSSHSPHASLASTLTTCLPTPVPTPSEVNKSMLTSPDSHKDVQPTSSRDTSFGYSPDDFDSDVTPVGSAMNVSFGYSSFTDSDDGMKKPKDATPSQDVAELAILDEFNINLELSKSEKRESNIPKTGFDFLDDW